MDPKEKFESHVSKQDSGCWLWIGAKSISGYGVCLYERKTQLAHRVAYKLYHNKDIDSGLLVCHSCQNKHCVAPEHLSLGTREKNNGPDKRRDKTDCGGEKCHFAKLTWDSVRDIRRLALVEKRKDIADKYKINLSTISSIIQNKTWKE